MPKFLVADDDPVNLMLVNLVLSPMGYQVLECSTGSQAWRYIEQEKGPLLALLDWHMPEPDGLELCRRIRELGSDRAIYVILLTGQSGREAIVSGLEAGANDYIVKPFDKQELFARLRVGLRVLQLQVSLAERVKELESALARVKQLQGLLPICSYCKSIRSDEDYWEKVECYLSAHSAIQFSHGICPDCYTRVVEPELLAYCKERNLGN